VSEILVVIGILIALIGVAAAVKPRALHGFARRVTVKTWLRVIAFVIRSLLGGLLILVAPSTAFPLAVRVIGVLLIVSGVAVLLIGNQGIQRMIDRALRLGPGAIVAGGLIGVLFGGLLIYLGL
jgi:hypothetical protein